MPSLHDCRQFRLELFKYVDAVAAEAAGAVEHLHWYLAHNQAAVHAAIAGPQGCGAQAHRNDPNCDWGGEGYLGLVNEVHARLANAEANGLDPNVVATVLQRLIQLEPPPHQPFGVAMVGANPFYGLRELGTRHALLTNRASSALLCQWLRSNPGYTNHAAFEDADDTAPGMMNLRHVALRLGGAALDPAVAQISPAELQAWILQIANHPQSLLAWHRFARRMGAANFGGGAGAQSLSQIDVMTLQYILANQDHAAAAVVQRLRLEHAVQALAQVVANPGQPAFIAPLGLATPYELFADFRALLIADPAPAGFGAGLLDAETRNALQAVLANVPGVPQAALVGGTNRNLQRRLRCLARLAFLTQGGMVNGVAARDLVGPIGMGATWQESAFMAALRRDTTYIHPVVLHGLAVGTAELNARLEFLAQVEVDTFNPQIDAGAEAATTFLLHIKALCGGNIHVPQVFSVAFLGRAKAYMEGMDPQNAGVAARRALLASLTAIGGGGDPHLVRLLGDGNHAEFMAALRQNIHREFDLHGLMASLLHGNQPILPGVGQPGHAATVWFDNEWMPGVRALMQAQGGAADEFATYGALAQMQAAEMVQAALQNPHAPVGVFGAPIAHAIAYLAGAGNVQAAHALQTLTHVGGQVTPQTLRILWSHRFDHLGRRSGYAIAAACSTAALQNLAGPNVDPAFVASLEFGHASFDGVTPVMAAARAARNGSAQLAAFQLLLQRHQHFGLGPVDARDARGWRAVHHAASLGNTEAAAALLAHGCQAGYLPGDTTSVICEAFACRDVARYAQGIWFVEQSVAPALGQAGLAACFELGQQHRDVHGYPRTIANVGIRGPQHLRFVRFAAAYPGVWAGLTHEAVAWMIGQGQIDRFRLVASMNEQVLADRCQQIGNPQVIFRVIDAMLPAHVTRTIGFMNELQDLGGQVFAIDAHPGQQSVFRALADKVDGLAAQGHSIQSHHEGRNELVELANTMLGVNPQARAHAVGLVDPQGRSSVKAATQSGQILLATLLARALAPANPADRQAMVAPAARVIREPQALGGVMMLPGHGPIIQVSAAGEVLLNVGNVGAGRPNVYNLGQQMDAAGNPIGPAVLVAQPCQHSDVVNWLNRLEVQAAIESALAAAFDQPNYFITFGDFLAWLQHMGQ